MQVTHRRDHWTPGNTKKSGRPSVDSVERFLSQAGDTWTFLILREAFFGVRRFDEILKNLSVAPNTLTDRLKRLVVNGILEKRPYQGRRLLFEYRLTEKGLDLYPYIVMMIQWGDRWLDKGKGPPLLLVHKSCGKVSHPVIRCDQCNQPIRARDMTWRPGPGARRQKTSIQRKKSSRSRAAGKRGGA
jgi:DNA-binding HxlR family transcriptional regulator